ncbi:MAG TPA: hypothetical protein VFA48_09000 [Gammaproteobacteria bacterium]|nr:hypothetical protein [Gammaproteobacteria bacterium]
MDTSKTNEGQSAESLVARLDAAIEELAAARSFVKGPHAGKVLQLAGRILGTPEGPGWLYERAPLLDRAGIFADTDWATPEILQADIAASTLRLGSTHEVTMECISELRLLAIAESRYAHPTVSAEQAHHYLTQVLALNLELLFAGENETARVRLGRMAGAVSEVLQLLIQHIGYDHILERLVTEIWRILAQRPIRVENLKGMIAQISTFLYERNIPTPGARGTDRLISALFGPTQASADDPGLEAYRERIKAMDAQMLRREAGGLARAMHDTGLVSAYHPVFLRYVLENSTEEIPRALGLSATGRDAYLCYQELVHALIDAAIFPETPQALYGLTMMLERAVLFAPAVAPALWRQLQLELCPAAENAIARAVGTQRPPHVQLLAGVLGVMGLPLGIGQGNNPTCQSARAISMWAHNDPDYLLQTIAWAARDDELVMHFEGQRLSSRELRGEAPGVAPMDVDAVSAVLVPHLDRIYHAMGELCAGRGDDPHRWINPEFHGWWVGRGFMLAVDLTTGKLKDYETFVRNFYAYYHPFHNGNQPLAHPQPAGLAMTDSAGRFVGWHAITIQRVALDQDEEMRVYFYNPNNDSGQDFGNGVRVSTEGRGERYGESSLPVAEFVSRLYIFHFDALEHLEPMNIPASEVARVEELARGSWAAER